MLVSLIVITSSGYAQQSKDYKPPTVTNKLRNFVKDTSAVKLQDLFSLQNRLKFGNYLFSENDYLRAAVEYKEYLKNFDNDTIKMKFALCFFRIGRYTEAADNFKSQFFGSTLSEEARLLFYESHFFNDDYRSFRDLRIHFFLILIFCLNRLMIQFIRNWLISITGKNIRHGKVLQQLSYYHLLFPVQVKFIPGILATG